MSTTSIGETFAGLPKKGRPNFLLSLASLAQMERELIIERTRAGLEAEKRQGRVGGRKRRMTECKVKAARKLLSSGTPPRDVAQSLSVSGTRNPCGHYPVAALSLGPVCLNRDHSTIHHQLGAGHKAAVI
jgi:Resolvase, N terminal domain